MLPPVGTAALHEPAVRVQFTPPVKPTVPVGVAGPGTAFVTVAVQLLVEEITTGLGVQLTAVFVANEGALKSAWSATSVVMLGLPQDEVEVWYATMFPPAYGPDGADPTDGVEFPLSKKTAY